MPDPFSSRGRCAVTLLVGGLLALAACTSNAEGIISEPLKNAAFRVTPLHFGLKVSPDPAQNPIRPPERFSGYHVAVDYEVSADELEADVEVYAICYGTVVYSGYAEGYGGLLVERCRHANEDFTVIYGHLALKGLPAEGAGLKSGQRIGTLAPARSYASDGNRKHLHLGIHRGTKLDVRGYVQSEDEVADFLNPFDILPGAGILPFQPSITPYWQTEESTEER